MAWLCKVNYTNKLIRSRTFGCRSLDDIYQYTFILAILLLAISYLNPSNANAFYIKNNKTSDSRLRSIPSLLRQLKICLTFFKVLVDLCWLRPWNKQTKGVKIKNPLSKVKSHNIRIIYLTRRWPVSNYKISLRVIAALTPNISI